MGEAIISRGGGGEEIELLTHTRTGTVHVLISENLIPTTGYISAIFKTTADFVNGDTFTLNGTVYTAQNQLATTVTNLFKSGVVVSIVIDVTNKKINFKSGGGEAGSVAASGVAAGILPAGVVATNGTDYTASRLRNAYFSTTVPTSLPNGTICFVYEA